MPLSNGWYCVLCNGLLPYAPRDGMCPKCPTEPVFDLSKPEGLAAARHLEQEEALARLRKRHVWANLLSLPSAFLILVGLAVIFFAALALVAWRIYLLTGWHMAQALPGVFASQSGPTLVAAFGAAFVFAVYRLRRRANRKFRASEARRAQQIAGGALEAKIRGGCILEKDDPEFALAPDSNFGVRED